MRFRFRPTSKPHLSISIFFVIIAIILVFSTAGTYAEISTESDEPCSAHETKPTLCPIRCFRPDPVCGVNGVTYWCGCDEAACEGVKVAKIGYCEVGNGGSGQALLLVHIVWLIVVGFLVVFGFF